MALGEQGLAVKPVQAEVNPWIVAIAVMSATFMEVLDTTVVNVSLPHIAGSLSASVDEATWVLTSYLVANAIVLPITGWLGNYFGRKRILMTAVTGFTFASFLCGMAPSLPVLIILRIIQGATGGALQPLSQAVMLEAFPPRDRGKAMAFWGLGIVVAPMLGPVLGGWLTDSYSWRWIFYINLPVGAVSLFMIKMFIFDPPYIRRRPGGVDFVGIALLAIGIGAVQVVLDKGQEEDWFGTEWVFWMAVAGVVTLLIFLAWELYSDHPVVRLNVFRNRTFSAGVLLMTTLGFVLYGSMVALPILLQTLLGYPALEAGIALAPRGLGSFLFMPVIGVILAKVDPRKALVIGLVTAAFTLLQLSWLNLNAGYWDFFWPQIIQGAALAFLFVPLTTVTMDPISKEDMGNATSVFNLMRNMGGSFGIAAATTMIARKQQAYTNLLVQHVTPYDAAARNTLDAIKGGLIGRGMDPATATQQSYAVVNGMVQHQAAIMSFLEAFRILAILFLLMLPLLLLMKKPAHTRGGMAAH